MLMSMTGKKLKWYGVSIKELQLFINKVLIKDINIKIIIKQ